MTPPILFEDGEALVIDKPAGLPVDRPRAGGPCLDDHLDALRLGFARRPVPVHRLDRDTSGCLLLARNPKALRRFGAAFEAKRVEKLYFGVLAGLPAEDGGRVDLPLAKVSSAERGWRMVPDPTGKPASTLWEVRDRRDGLAPHRVPPGNRANAPAAHPCGRRDRSAVARRPGLWFAGRRGAHDAACRRADRRARRQAADRRACPIAGRLRRAGLFR